MKLFFGGGGGGEKMHGFCQSDEFYIEKEYKIGSKIVMYVLL